MLILRRKAGQSLILDERIKVTVTEIDGDGVRLAIDAPREVAILREELLEAVKANQEAAADPEQIGQLKGIFKHEK
ncbi:MAG: carbon storage regulator [Lachnospiraceae bacterium]|jgi:carbon storage regulator|nr:carbon storage regulator [Lachnospiraceae bacterium]